MLTSESVRTSARGRHRAGLDDLASSEASSGSAVVSRAPPRPPKADSAADGRLLKLERDLHDARAELARLRVALTGTEASAQRARHDALPDSLTGRPNRRGFHERLDEAVARADAAGTCVAVLYIDLDGFKSINDTLGHDRGDELLRIVAARLSRAIRASDLVSLSASRAESSRSAFSLRKAAARWRSRSATRARASIRSWSIRCSSSTFSRRGDPRATMVDWASACRWSAAWCNCTAGQSRSAATAWAAAASSS